jgi:hypothetical protein
LPPNLGGRGHRSLRAAGPQARIWRVRMDWAWGRVKYTGCVVIRKVAEEWGGLSNLEPQCSRTSSFSDNLSGPPPLHLPRRTE